MSTADVARNIVNDKSHKGTIVLSKEDAEQMAIAYLAIYSVAQMAISTGELKIEPSVFPVGIAPSMTQV